MSNKQSANVAPRLLTEVELEIMTLIWELGTVAVKDVIAKLPKERNLAYTTVATVIKVLEQKGFLECRKDSHAHVFSPIVAKADYERTSLEHMVVNVFDGEPVALVQRLLEAKKLSKDEIAAIENILKNISNPGRVKK